MEILGMVSFVPHTLAPNGSEAHEVRQSGLDELAYVFLFFVVSEVRKLLLWSSSEYRPPA